MKRKMHMGKHTSLSTHLREKIQKLYKDVKAKRVILGLTKGGTHSFHDGKLRYRRHENKIIHLTGYGNGITDIIIIVEKDSDAEKVKLWIDKNG